LTHERTRLAERLAELAKRLEGADQEEAQALGADALDLERDLDELRALMVATSKLAELGRASAAQNHELRQPVLAIRAVAHLLADDADDAAAVRAHATLIREQAERMVRLLASFRGSSFAVAAPGGDAIGDVGTAATRVRILVAYRLKERVKLDVDVPRDLPRVPLSADRLEQVLLNLVVNAIDAVEDRGVAGGVVVRGRHEAGNVEIFVGDEGAGIPAEVQARLFEPYFTTKGGDRGTGLGLVICRELARTAGGAIDVCDADTITRLAPWPRPIRTLVRLTLPAQVERAQVAG
jgi:C4-dicarboxylate-specific signal transduction histidine kinase